MQYSIDQIALMADCDALILDAGLERRDLEIKKMQQEKLYETVISGTAGIEGELAGVTSEIQANETVVATMIDGPIKKMYESKLTKLRHKKFLLEERKERYGIIALLKKEYSATCIDKQLAETVSYIDALIRRKSAL